MKNVDLIYKNTGRRLAHRIQQNALEISRSNMARDGALPLMSEEGQRLAKNTAPRNAYEVVGVDSRQKMSLGDDEPEMWRRFQPGDNPSSVQPDPLSALISTEQSDESEEELDEEPEEETEEDDLLDPETVKTGNAFDRQRLYRAIDRLTRRTQKQFTKGRDGRSYARDDGRSYSTAHGCIGGAAEWNALFSAGEIS